jgi:YD repeat-containing protein
MPPVPTPTATPIATPPIPVPSPTAPPIPTGHATAGGGSADLGTPNSLAGTKAYPFYFTRFIISPSYDEHSSFSSPFFGAASYDPGPSFDFFTPPMLQTGSSKIAFASNRDGRVQIYVMSADGSNQVRLTNNGGNDDGPRFSPNGAKILFQSDRDDAANGYNDIYVMNSDGSGQTRLTTAAGDDCAPSWSPDGTKIVFQSLRNGVSYQVYSMNADGSNQVNLSNSTGGGGGDRQPSWSPDGAKIAFASERDHTGFASVYVMNASGTNQQRLTFSADTVTDEQPVWSRDGSKIAFVSTRDSVVESWQETDDSGGVLTRTAVRTNKEVYVMSADGSGQSRLTNDLGNDDSPYWSPDGVKIVFRSDRLRDCCDPTSQVWAMNADGSGATNLSVNLFGDYSSSWTSGGANQSPVAAAGGSYSGITGQNTVLSGTGSFDSDGSITSYSWSFGDGTTGSGVSPTHAYASPGTYTVTLTVTDNLGAQGANSTTASVSSSSGDQYTASFLQWGLARQPSGDEGLYWADIMRAAYPKGQTSMLLAMRELGMTVFESAEYAGRNRSDHWYVYDLYKTYLMREPDAPGWAFWESQLPSMGREQLRRAFDESGEFNNIVATLTANGAPSSAVSSLASARVDPFNQTGDQLRARDCEWGVGLLSLPGRAGLDLGLGLSYSSLVWTRSGPYAYFDEDRGSPSPGFRLGFATIQGPFFDAKVGRNVYMLVTSSGSRVELRQVGTTSTYEAGDSSYLQLIVGGSLLLRSTDGTQMAYSKYGDEWRATAIEDRNGNFMSAGYNWRGDITNVTDTLGRVITFTYDANLNLSTITQSWQVSGVQQMHVWASFGWGTQSLGTPASGLSAVGMYSGETIPVLTQVGLGDGSRFNFEYTSAGQVRVIHRYSSDNVERSRVTYDYAMLADDCPRVITTRVWADNWTGINGVPSEVETQLSDPGNGSHEMTLPDSTVYKEIYGTGWQKGLTTQSEVRSGGALQKQTVTQLTQDDTTVNYQTNPRVTETNIYDFPVNGTSNRRRTTIDYGAYAQYGLPYLVKEYAADGVTPLRQSYTDYNVNQAYLDRRIIGLVSSSKVYDPVAALWLAKMTYAYDAPANINSQATTATGHDQTYNTSFLTRGNVTGVSRWDATDIGNAAKALTSQASYDAAGSTLSRADPLGHQTSIAYADSFSDLNNSRNTFAYPTTLTDADGFSSSVQYNFDFGARTRAQGPPPAGQTSGVIQTFTYDTAARVDRVTTTNNGAYVRYLYGPNYVGTFSSVNTVADEAYTNTVFDGMGRALIAASNNPGGGGDYRAQVTQYDLMGRAVKQSNPADVDSGWNPVGPDDGAGWLYTQQSYDWKGRPKITTSTDGTQRSASYEGCGCAGGEVVTVTDEVGRQQKAYSDALGRQWKSEVLNWDGSVYSTTTSTLNALDQVKIARRYQGTDGSGVFQEMAMSYDGYGRLQSRHAPEQNAGAATVYSYNTDDTLTSITDARGATVTYSLYNNRRLPLTITFGAPSPIPVPAQVTYSYDAAGNRTQMTDGSGGVEYVYDSLSRLREEKRTFAGLSNNAPYSVGYDYTLSGQLKSVTYPSGAVINYGYDQSRRLDNITGGGFGDVTQFASGIKYRASGAVKHLAYGNGLNLDLAYDARQRITQQKLAPVGVPSQGQVNRVHDYQYYDDGRVKFIADNYDHNFDRSYSYDQVGRLTQAFTGHEARGEQFGPTSPYKETFQYDEWNNTTDRFTRTWSYQTGMQGFRSNGQWVSTGPVAYQNNRRSGVGYDADGRVTSDGFTHVYDATGRQTSVQDSHNNVTQEYDGDGRRVKRVEAVSTTSGTPPVTTTTTTTVYEVRSSVLGGVVEELDAQGVRKVDYVYAGAGIILAKGAPSGTPSSAIFVNHQAVTGSEQLSWNGQNSGRTELDPLGADVGTFEPVVDDPGRDFPMIFGAMRSANTGCLMDGLAIPCTVAGEIADFNQRTGSRMMQISVSSRFADRLRGRVDDTSGREQSVGAIPGTRQVWVDTSTDIYIPGTNEIIGYDVDGRPVYDAGRTINVDSGYFMAMPNGSPLTTVVTPQKTEHPDFVRDFYKYYQKRLARCIWRIFGKDAFGEPSNVPMRLERQTLSNAPAVDMSKTFSELGNAWGSVGPEDLTRGQHGTVNIASNINERNPGDFGVVLTKHQMRIMTYGHELGNLIIGRLFNDVELGARMYGSPKGGVNPKPNNPFNDADQDAGARLEHCLFWEEGAPDIGRIR